MLVANPGQAPYSIVSKKACSNKSARNNATVSTSNRFIQPSSVKIAPSTSTVITKTMTAITAIPINNEPNNLKALSVRITREADLFKSTVQKKLPTHIISDINVYTVPPTIIHQYPERIETHSVDSLKSEMCHFKPIRTVPTTLPKRSKVATIQIPEAKLAAKESNSYNKEGHMFGIKLTEKIDYSRQRTSAFSFVALSGPNINQHKTTDIPSCDYRKKSNQNIITGKLSEVPPTQGIAIISSSQNVKAPEQFISPTSVKHRTRRNTKTLTSTLSVEQQNNKTIPQRETRVTRKRQHQMERNESVPMKNVKLSKDCSKPLKNGRKRNANTGRLQPNRRTPPVTRSRLKQSMTHTRKQYQHK